ncbi:hypothetical protein SYNTR_1603 [Candidatus Syntrophocurvum alkaliphilum]|uniref:Probable membrane transporter protein n=1 Tax=Candidatus Syntrophocurvum alkaliphilum TaxID=2293317 RepID=A0A6I6DGH5_9FIRM|nr:sulfite exporter TauE/SafE family protein [Candidatus Syntrophocurvum alkaliphilum]QGU00197.1 hypothetical protein SYNTR_1603 [Candidatus Syntrophocurvum alkaliphilum]
MGLIIYLIITGILAGILGAILGLGGGIIMLPAIQLLLGFEPLTAVGTTLVAIVFTSISGAYGHYRAGNVLVKKAITIGAGGLIGIIVGSFVFKEYFTEDVSILTLLLGILFFGMCIRMAYESYKEWKIYNAKTNNDLLNKVKTNKQFLYPLFILGIVTGCLTGMLGLGGGFILVPAILWILSLSPSVAVGTTLLAMFPITAFGGAIKLMQGFVDIQAAILLGIGTIIGAQIGVKISSFISPLIFRLLFTVIFAYMSFVYLTSSF